MKFEKVEYHRVNSTFSFDIPDDEIVERFGSLERFLEVVSHYKDQDSFDYNPIGEEPTDEESDAFFELESWFGHEDREDDWITERKGGYDVSYNLVEE